MPEIFEPERISLSDEPTISESVIQNRIAENPAILGIGGDLILRDRERIQAGAGRLDLLLQDQDTNRRYEVEIQLGRTDESHIIRTIEYWDIERKRYPQYDHCAVIIAEDITSRFHNVISLFNGSIPLIAIKMNAYRFDDRIGLVFTTVLDEVQRGDDEEEEEAEIADRNYWIRRASENTIKMADTLLDVINEFSQGYELKYRSDLIGLIKDGRKNNFVFFLPRRNAINIYPRIPFSEEIQRKIDENDLDSMSGYDRRWGRFRLRLSQSEIVQKKEVIKELLSIAYKNSI